MKAEITITIIFLLLTACKKETTKAPTATACSKFALEGIWIRTANGPNGDPACIGEKIEYKDGKGIILSEPAGCKFKIGDVKWLNFSPEKCTILNTYFADPSLTMVNFRDGKISFTDATTVVIHGVTYTK